MKVLITSDCYIPTVNGVVTSILSLKEGLEMHGHQVKIITLSDSKTSYCQGNVTYIGALDASRVYPNAKIRMKGAREYINDIVAWGPDIVHSQSEISTFLIAKRISKKLSIPLIHTYHTVYEDYTHYFSPSVKMGKMAVSKLSNWIANRSSGMIAPTEKVKNILKSYEVKTPIYVVPTGIHLSRFAEPVPQNYIQNLRQELSIPEGNRVIVSVSRLAREKNIDELITGFSKAQAEKATLVIVGDGPHRAELEAMARAGGKGEQIRFTGMVSPQVVVQYYQMADLFVSASNSETQGLTYIEALASGVPLLCKQDECLKEIVVEGENGWMYRSEAEFVRKLDGFISQMSLYEAMGQSASAYARRFSMEAFATSVENLYLKCV